MSQAIIFISCMLVLTSLVQCKTKITDCQTKRIQLKHELNKSIGELKNIAQKEMPSFNYSEAGQCGSYFKKHAPFPKVISIRNFLGSKFIPKIYKIFKPFMDATIALRNGSTADGTKAPEKQLKSVNFYLKQLVICANSKLSSVKKPVVPVKYNVTLHKMDVKKCLINAGTQPTPKRVRIVQYNEVFSELSKIMDRVAFFVSQIRRSNLK